MLICSCSVSPIPTSGNAAGGETVNANNTLQRQRFTAAEGQTDFTLTEFSYVPNTGSTIVFYNGSAQQLPADYVELSSTVIKLNFDCNAGDVVDVIGFTGISAVVENIRLFNNSVVATAVQTQISTAVAYRAGTSSTAVYENGVRLVPGVDYTETDNASFVTLTTPAAGGETYFSVVGQLVNDVGSDAALISYLPAGTGAVATTVEQKLRERISVFDFMTPAEIASVQARDLLVDVSSAVQKALNQAIAIGAVVFFPAGSYRLDAGIILANSDYLFSGGMQGENASSTRIYFFNATVLEDMFYIDSDINYFTISDLEFIDNTPRTSRGFYFFDTRATGSPAWKHLFKNVRITNFKEAGVFDGGATIADDAHCSEVMFLHSKCRNCETGLIYNNTQAVNHQLIGMDFENDTEGVSDEWTHILMKRGTTINHVGGSVIGKGSYLKYKYSEAGGFQNTSQFVSKGVRVEKRGGAAPIISHDTTSIITVSNSLRVIIEDMPVVASGGATLFARFGGRTFAKFSNVHSNLQMDVEAYTTSNLASNGEVGNIILEDCKALNYKRISTVTAYGSAGVAATNYVSIPARISQKGEGTLGQNDGAGYYTVNAPEQDIYGGAWQLSRIKSLTLANNISTGFGNGANPATAQVNLPLFARPVKFRILRDTISEGSPFVLTLIFVIGGVDYTVATITPGVTNYGHFEANISIPTVLDQAIVDGTVWDGKMKVVKSGTLTGFTGLIMIDYM